MDVPVVDNSHLESKIKEMDDYLQTLSCQINEGRLFVTDVSAYVYQGIIPKEISMKLTVD